MATLVKNKGISLTIIAAIVFATSFGYVVLTKPAEAAALTSVKDVLSTSTPATAANHTLYFITPTGAGDDTDTITLTFDSSPAFTLTGVTEDDIDIAEDTDGSPTSCSGTLTDKTTAASADATSWGVGISGQVITFTHPTNAANGDIAAGACVIIEIGTNATASGTGANQITNPTKVASAGTADISSIDIAGTFGDTGTALVATVEGVTVSVTVQQSLSFSIAAVTNNNCDSDFATLAGPDSTVSTVPFGSTASTNTFLHGCQDLTISTNATSGYSVTTEENTNLISGSTVLADTTGDNTTMTESTADTWGTNTNNGFGYSCKNKSGSPCVISAVTDYKQFACKGNNASCDPGSGGETAQNVMTKGSPANGDQARVEYKLSISGTQPAGTYSNTITYIATPTF